jgi:uncharacterized membrane protein
MNSNENSTMPLASNSGHLSVRHHRRLFFAMLAFALVGFLDSTYLAIEHFLNRVPPCSLVTGCEIVTTSKYSVIFGVPLALLGALYYLAVIVALVLYLDMRRDFIIKWTARVTAFGFVFSLWLVYLQLFVIKAICQYCMLSAISSTGLFVVGVLMLRSFRTHNMEQRT